MIAGCLLSASLYLLVGALACWLLGWPVVAVVMLGAGAVLAARVWVYGTEEE